MYSTNVKRIFLVTIDLITKLLKILCREKRRRQSFRNEHRRLKLPDFPLKLEAFVNEEDIQQRKVRNNLLSCCL